MKKALLVGLAIIATLLLAVDMIDNARIEQNIKDELKEDLVACHASGLENCHIELWHDKDGTAIGGEVLGR